MKRVLLGILLTVGLGSLTGCNRQASQAQEPLVPTPVMAEARGPASGKILFEQNCAGCHAISGKGNRAMLQGEHVDFTNAGFQRTLTDGVIKHTIQNGRGMMPAFAGTFTPKELDALVQYVKSFAKK